MEAFVLDASVALSWCFPNDPIENPPYSRRILQQIPEADAVVPEIWAFEIANGVFVAFSKRKRINEADISEYVKLLESLPIRVVGGEWLGGGKQIVEVEVRLDPLAVPPVIT